MTELVVNDALEELRQENHNLIKDLNLTLKLLETYRSCLVCFTKNCNCPENDENKTKFDKLEEYFNKVNDRIAVKHKDLAKDVGNDGPTEKQSDYESTEDREHTESGVHLIDGSAEVMNDKTSKPSEDNRNEESMREEVVNNDENNEKVVQKCCNQPKNLKRKRFLKNTISKRFVCEYCKKSFGDNYHLVRHIRGCHTLEKPYKCLKCDKRFAISEGLSQHVRINHKDYNMFKCSHENCDFKTIIEERLTTHLAKHEIIRQFECEVCNKTYLTKYELKYHKQRIHRIFEPKVRKRGKSKRFTNSQNGETLTENLEISCADSYVSLESVEQSQSFDDQTMNQIISGQSVQLIVVESQTTQPILSGIELKRRLKPRKYRNKLGTTEDIVCQVVGCGKYFLSEYNLRKHMRTVHSDNRPHVCEWPGCDSAFKTREGMNCHLAAHRNERNFQCDVEACDKRFNTRQEVHQHKRSHGIKKIDRYACSWPACGVMCQSAQALTEHVNRHQNIKPFKCSHFECEKTYFTAYELRQHAMKVHDKSESFHCDYADCAMNFLNKRDLAKHRRLHDDVAKFVCSWPECSHTFNTSRDLSDHMNRHLDIKANKCCFVGCDRSYFKRAHLNRHIKQCHSMT